MTKSDPFQSFQSNPEIIRLAVMLYVWFSLSLRYVKDLLHGRGISISLLCKGLFFILSSPRPCRLRRRRLAPSAI